MICNVHMAFKTCKIKPHIHVMRRTILILIFLIRLNLSWSQLTADSLHPSMPPEVEVYDAYKFGYDSAGVKERNSAGIGDILMVKVHQLKTLLDRSKCMDANGNPIPGCRAQEIRLFIDGRRIDSLSPESGAPLRDDGPLHDGTLQFHLERNSANDETWTDILGAPKIGPGFTYHASTISVGLENEYAEKSLAKNFHITRVKENWFWICLIFLCIYLSALIYLAKRKNLLRDRRIDASSLNINGKKMILKENRSSNPSPPPPYSLARFQMAFWFTLTISSFLFIWLITGAFDIITTSILGLVGISAGTTLSAVVIDNNKNQEMINQTSLLIEEEQKIKNSLPDLKDEIKKALPQETHRQMQDELRTQEARLKIIEPIIEKNKKLLVPKGTHGFLSDILSDANGISFHRLQMFVWTLILGLLFIYSVWMRLSMPEFSATLLALQGITAGTYLGFKIPEKQD